MSGASGKRVFIGVAWPYVNGDLHIGHYAGYLLPADICARYNRLRGRQVLMVSGSDCFGTPITIEADKMGRSPKEIVDEYHERDVKLFELLGLSYDLYTKTDTENHKRVTQDFFVKLLDEGFIFNGSSNQYYSKTEKRFLPDRYVEGTCPNCDYEGARSDQCDKCGAVLKSGELISPVSKNTGAPVALRETEHYFLDWPKLEPFLKDYIGDSKRHPLGFRSWVKNETLGWLKSGLKPREITRDLDWGIPLPIERIPASKRIKGIENKRIYVWFEAVIGYLSASIEWSEILKRGDWRDFWYGENLTHYYFMGKDNLIFHTLFWPGQLFVYDKSIHLPDFFSINQFLNLEGQKFSKSRGVIVDTRDIVERFGNDPVRFYLCLIMPEDADSNFAWEDFYEKTNNVLIGNFANFVNRVLTIGKDVDLSSMSLGDVFPEVSEKLRSAFGSSYESLDRCKFKSYLEAVLSLSSFGNQLMTVKAPWKLKKSDYASFIQTVFNLKLMVFALGVLLQPLIPGASRKVLSMLGSTENPVNLPESGMEVENLATRLKTFRAKEPAPLFARIEKDGLRPH